MGFWKQLGLLLWKNYTLRKRQKVNVFQISIYFRKTNDLVCVLMSRFRVYLINNYSGIVNETELDFISNQGQFKFYYNYVLQYDNST